MSRGWFSFARLGAVLAKEFIQMRRDRVTFGSRRLGTLVNTVTTSRDAPPWKMGIAAFVRNLAGRGLIDRI